MEECRIAKKNENLQDKLEVPPIEVKMRETRPAWFVPIQRRPIDGTVRKLII